MPLHEAVGENLWKWHNYWNKGRGAWYMYCFLSLFRHNFLYISQSICLMRNLCLFEISQALSKCLFGELNCEMFCRWITKDHTLDLVDPFHQDVLIRRWNRFCDPMKKKNRCDVAERHRGSWLLELFSSLQKMPSIFCEFRCYNRKLCVNQLISLFSYNTGPISVIL